MWYVYILQSLRNNSFYTGYTNDLERRVEEHNNSTKANSFTYKNRPYKLVYSETFLVKKEAAQREKYFKTGKGRDELKLLIGE